MFSPKLPSTRAPQGVTIPYMYPRIVKVRSSNGTVHEYVRIVESYRQDGKNRQRVVADLGRKDVLAELLPRLRRLLAGEDALVDEQAGPDVEVLQAFNWGPMLAVRSLAEQLWLPAILGKLLADRSGQVWDGGTPVACPADRALVLIANRLIRPGSEHALAGWLVSDWVCDSDDRRPPTPPKGEERAV